MTNTAPTWLPRLERWLVANRPAYVERLAPGAPADAVADLPPNLAALFLWHNGQKSGADSLLLRHWFPSLANLHAQRKEFAKARDEDDLGQQWWGDAWFPFLDDGQGNLTCLDAASGKVLLVLNDTEERNDLAPSLEVFFSTLVESLEAGHWRIDEEGRAVVIDGDAFSEHLRAHGVCFDAYGY